ncbi:MAG: hypothetical protein JSV86_18540 [Gemmatimonadota bacterium]|nr:MAG: hypothetical protein JSV86_18540 [Gemmatimonadota bacterium]
MIDFLKLTHTEREMSVKLLEEVSDRLRYAQMTVHEVLHLVGQDVTHRASAVAHLKLSDPEQELALQLLNELSDRVVATEGEAAEQTVEQILHHLALDVIAGTNPDEYPGR